MLIDSFLCLVALIIHELGLNLILASNIYILVGGEVFLGIFFFCFLIMKVARGHPHSNWGKSPVPCP